MSGNSLETLLAWMKDNSRMLRWGMIVALERRKANVLMTQEYIRRFEVGSYLPPVRGDVEIVENQWIQVIHDFVMDVPLLSFENADLNDSKARLSMSVVGGTQLSLKRESAGWKAVLVDEIDSLQGPKLYLDLQLNQVPGNVDEDGRIILDLSRSDNFRLTFGPSEDEQRLGGDFFKDLFNQLVPEKRIWPLGRIERGTDESVHPKSFGLRTQASGAAARDPQSSEHGNGAILAFVRMSGSSEGDYPGANSGFRYLIPDDTGKDYSATVLFNPEQLSSVLGKPLLDNITEMIGSDDFERVYNNGRLVSAVAKAGGIRVNRMANPLLPIGIGGQIVVPWITRDAIVISANSEVPCTLISDKNKFSVRWVSKSSAAITITFKNMADEELWPTITRTYLYSVDLQAEFELVDVADADGIDDAVMRATTFDLLVDAVDTEAALLSGEETSNSNLPALLLYVLGQLVLLFVNSIGPKIRLALNKDLRVDIVLKPLIENLIKLNFGQAIQGGQLRSGYDIGYFGRVNPSQTSFLSSPMRPQMLHGHTQQFSTEPVIQGVQWTVENLPENAGNPGTISADGLYQAPAAASIEGRFKRVRVTATDPGSGYHSSALVTVLLDELSVHPLIQICDVGTSVELAAGALKEGELIWSIKNPVANESGQVRPSVEPEGDHTYHHGPVVPNKTYVLDEIEVKNRQTNKTRSVHVLALQKAPFLSVEILHTDSKQGQVRLQASYNGSARDVEWRLPLGGPGSIDSTGLYRVAPTATERFVLIFALMAGTPFGDLEGHLILPLPLVEFPQLLEVLSQ